MSNPHGWPTIQLKNRAYAPFYTWIVGQPWGLDKFGNDFYDRFLCTFCFLKEFLIKKFFQKISNFFPLVPPMDMKWKWKKNLKIFFLQFHSRYQNVHIRQNHCWFQNFPNPTGWATIRLQNRAQGTPAMCPILWLNCGSTSWARKVLKTPLFMIYVYILILGIIFQFGDDDFETFLRGTP